MGKSVDYQPDVTMETIRSGQDRLIWQAKLLLAIDFRAAVADLTMDWWACVNLPEDVKHPFPHSEIPQNVHFGSMKEMRIVCVTEDIVGNTLSARTKTPDRTEIPQQE